MKQLFQIILKLFFLIVCLSIPSILGNNITVIKNSEIVNIITFSKKKPVQKPKKKHIIKYISHQKFYNQIAKIESKGNYNVANKHLYFGKYQASEATLKAFGLSQNQITSIVNSIETTYSQRGKAYYTFNVELFPAEEQERFIRWYMQRMEQTHLRSIIKKYAGKECKGIHITKAGILYASMMGYGNVQSYFQKKHGGSSAIRNRLIKYQYIELLDN